MKRESPSSLMATGAVAFCRRLLQRIEREIWFLLGRDRRGGMVRSRLQGDARAPFRRLKPSFALRTQSTRGGRSPFVMELRPELSQKDRGDQLQRSDLKRKIDQAVYEDSDERQRAKRNPHSMLAGDRPWVSPKVKNRANDPASDQYSPKEEPQSSPFEGGLQIVLMRVAQDAIDSASVLHLEVRKDNRKSTRSESEPARSLQGKPADSINVDTALPERPTF